MFSSSHSYLQGTSENRLLVKYELVEVQRLLETLRKTYRTNPNSIESTERSGHVTGCTRELCPGRTGKLVADEPVEFEK